jgi:hypothetical protein
MYLTVLNGIPAVATYLHKPLLYHAEASSWTTLGATYDDDHVNQLVENNGGFRDGWCHLEDYWVVHDDARQSAFFKRLAMIGQYYSLPTEAPAFLARLPVGGRVASKKK